MRKPAGLALLIFLVVLLASCAAAAPLPAGGDKPIEPGGRIGSVTVIKGEGDDILYQWDGVCPGGTDAEPACKARLGQQVNVSMGVFDDTHSGKLDSLWAEHTYEMSIKGRPVNLKAFGSIDVSRPLIAKVRAWNVVLVADKPGEITIHSKGVVGGKPITQTMTYTFSAP
jgi:hypothetical protein